MKRNDIILFACVLAVAAILFGISLLRRGTDEGAWVVVSIKGKEYGRYTLNEDREVEIEGPLGSNHLVISAKDGAHMEAAVCPDHYCIKQGVISKRGQQLVCLPNSIVVEVVGGESSELDATVY